MFNVTVAVRKLKLHAGRVERLTHGVDTLGGLRLHRNARKRTAVEFDGEVMLNCAGVVTNASISTLAVPAAVLFWNVSR